MISQPPTRLATSVPDQSLASWEGRAFFATTVTTGTRKPSVNSSLRPSISASGPMVKAMAPSSWLPVSSMTRTKAMTPKAMSVPATKPVTRISRQLRLRRCTPCST